MIPMQPILKVRAGTGGDEAAIFSGDLFRMYSKYAETHKVGVLKYFLKMKVSMAVIKKSFAVLTAKASMVV